MANPIRPLVRTARFAALLGPALLALTMPLRAETVSFSFEPPVLEAQPVCAIRAPDTEIADRWQAWDGTSLQGLDASAVQREMRRLGELDPQRWYDKIDAAITLLPSISPGYSADKAKVDRIELMIDAGRLRDLKALGLVDQLLAQSATASPRVKLALSRFLRRGQGIDADAARGVQLLVEAALGGNADALLELVSLQMAGQTVPGWDVSPDLAVAMAFGALVGQLDPMICDRVTRIAREYKNGDIVTRDMVLAERWYRFAADLGDADAAWRVAELHMRSENLEKDNAVLVTYLKRAAEQGSPFMALAYGRLFEIGALVPKDPVRADEIYARAATTGDRGALLRQVQFLTARLRDRSADLDATERADLATRHSAALQALVARDDAPAWALVAMADSILGRNGRWAGEAEAMIYLERAAAQKDGLAQQTLAAMRLGSATDLPFFYTQIDLMIDSVRGKGMVDPMADLQDAFACRAPDAPRADEALYWREVERATGTVTVSFDFAALADLAARPDPLALARLQSQALYGRPSALAQYLVYLDLADAPAAQQAFWKAYARRFEKVASAMGRLYLDSGQPELAAKALVILAVAVQAADDPTARVQYARALLSGPAPATQADRDIALGYLLPAADKGVGAALSLLPLADPQRWPDAAAVHADFGAAIDAGGDFDALVLALPFAGDRQPVYLARATTVTTCSFEQAIALTDALATTSDQPGFHRWTAIAAFLAGTDPWQMTALADRLMQHGTPAEADQGHAMYQAAWDQGFTTAGLRLLTLASDAKGRGYDPALAADLYAGLVETAEPRQLVTLLARLRKEDAAIVALTSGRIDPAPLYLRAAETGEPVAMREYGLILLAGADGSAIAAEAAGWLARAAEAGDGRAMVEYAQLLAFGVGVPVSRTEALVWLQRASDAGIEEAMILTRSLGLAQVDTQ